MAVLDVQNLTLSFGERTLFAGADYQALMDLTAKLDAATARRDDLYARWENASEELAAGEEKV